MRLPTIWKPLLLVYGVVACCTGVAQATDAPNLCAAGTKRASIAIGTAESGAFAASREIQGWLTFEALNTIGKDLWVVCYAPDGTKTGRPLPADVKECQTKAGVLRCSNVAGALEKSVAAKASGDAAARHREREVVNTDGLPDAVVAYAARWANACRQDGHVPQFASDFITPVDVDGDGKQDFILNGDGETCVDSATGGVTASGGGNGGTSFVIVANVRGHYRKLEFFVQSAEVLRYRGFAVAVIDGNNGRQVMRIRSGQAERISRVPSGGELVYTLSR